MKDEYEKYINEEIIKRRKELLVDLNKNFKVKKLSDYHYCLDNTINIWLSKGDRFKRFYNMKTGMRGVLIGSGNISKLIKEQAF